MSPLSELVWSPDDGLSIKIAASSLSTRKASLRWNADTLNIVISSPQQSGAKSGDNVDATLRDAGEMPSQPPTHGDTSVRVSADSPNRTQNIDAQQSTSITSQEQDSKCSGGISEMSEGEELSDNCCADKLNKEEVDICPTRCSNDASHSPASRKGALQSTSEKQAYCATAVHNERSWADNTWRARLVNAISQRDYVLPNNAVNAQSRSSFGSFSNTKMVPGKLAGFLDNQSDKDQDLVMQDTCNGNQEDQIMQGNFNGNHQDHVMQDHHKDEPIPVKCESASGVNPVSKCDSASGVNSVARYESTPDVNPEKLKKGKEKVMHDQSNCVSNTKEGDDSNESMESCPRTKAPKREYAQYSAAEMSSRNKRYRREYNEGYCSGLLNRNGSSFFNWMSSLTNGSTVFDKTTTAVSLNQKLSEATGHELAEHSLPLEYNSSNRVQSVGFNSLFQSLYSHNVMITSKDTPHQSEINCTEREALNGGNSMLHKEISTGRETLDVAVGNLAAGSLQMDPGGGKWNLRDQSGVFPLRAGRNLKMTNSNKSCSKTLEEQQNECHASPLNAAMGNKGGTTESLWVSRLLPKTSMKLMDATPCNVNSDFCAVNPKGAGDKLYPSSQQNINVEKEFNSSQYFTSTGSDNETTSSKCPVIPPEEHKQSETMASILAKRLDALRHAKTSAIRLAISSGISKDHNHRKSPFVINYSSHDGLETGQGTQKSSSGGGRLVLWSGDKGKEQLYPLSDEELRGNMLKRGEHQQCGGSMTEKAVAPHDILEANTSAEYVDRRGVQIKEVGSNSMESLPHNKQIVPYSIIGSDIDQSSVVFGALQRLRLPRSDIIRWLTSPIQHTTLDGFFLRLRFGKWEEALGGTGYHVARINGALDRNRLSVTIRNSTCQVDSRFVSNHGFHEDELKAWWSAAMKGGWKLPSKEELSKKLRERELLHFGNGTGQPDNT
ncbi:RNA polymerase-associated protein RTF1-like protein [Hordeum vulgare]|nr:RNA polymerase-associated protein RTF1-like protein [Hordeum vulgare]